MTAAIKGGAKRDDFLIAKKASAAKNPQRDRRPFRSPELGLQQRCSQVFFISPR
jgi:hypothetical protein